MSLIIVVSGALILFGGFLVLTAFESSDSRLLGSYRKRLDRFAARVGFVIAHVDWSAFVKHMSRTITERVLHDIAHATLLATRFIERSLTRTVRGLRERRVVPAAPVAKRSGIRAVLGKFRKIRNTKPVEESEEVIG